MAMKTRTLLVVFLCSIILASASDPVLPKLSRENQAKAETARNGDIITRSPFVFTDEDFLSFGDDNFLSRSLQKFTERSNVLVGLENYRVGYLQISPLTFVLPHHGDAELLMVIAQGRGGLSYMREDKRETFFVERGDIVMIPAGTTSYVFNRDENENFVMISFVHPVSVSGPGNNEIFVGAAGINPESFLRTFSSELLEAAYNIRSDRLERLLGTQTGGFVQKATKEQIKALSYGGGDQSKYGPFNILNKIPSRENEYGQLYEVNATDFKILQYLDVSISYFTITHGSMVLPFFNSKATQIAYVLKGEGYMEMVVPHLSPQGQYQRVGTPLKSGMVVVSPPGHPLITVASKNQNHNLEILAFYVNAKDNIKFPYAGENNVVDRFVNVAQEMAFAVPAKEVQDIFNSQEELFFSKGPSGLPRGARASI